MHLEDIFAYIFIIGFPILAFGMSYNYQRKGEGGTSVFVLQFGAVVYLFLLILANHLLSS